MAEALIVRLDQSLAEAGSQVAVDGVLAVDDFCVGDRDFSVPEGISYDLAITNAGEEVVVLGEAHATLEGTCDRCLEAATLELTGQVEALYGDEPGTFMGEDGEELEILPIENDAIDLTLPVRTAIAVEIPFKVLCKEDCKGLCPHCGKNLNEGPCDCEERLAAEGDPTNPFYALKAFKTSHGEPSEG